MEMESKSKNRQIDGVSRRNKNSENSFFRRKEKKPNFLAFWIGIILIQLIVFSLIFSFAISFKRQTVGESEIFGTEGASGNLVSFAERADSIKNSGRATLIFNNQEFTKASGATDDDFPLKKTAFEIKKESITLSGLSRDSFIPWPLRLKIQAVVAEQKFQFSVSSDNLENILLFGQDKERIESIFDQKINSELAKRGIIADEIKTADGYLELDVIKEIK